MILEILQVTLLILLVISAYRLLEYSFEHSRRKPLIALPLGVIGIICASSAIVMSTNQINEWTHNSDCNAQLSDIMDAHPEMTAFQGEQRLPSDCKNRGK